MAVNKQYVRKEHYIPQFSIRPFEISHGFCLTVNLRATPIEILQKKTENIMQEIDLYEVRDNAGNYVNRNEIENGYSKLENYIAPKFRRVLTLLGSEEADINFKNMIKTNEWADKEAALLLHLIVTLIRSPHLKNFIYDKEEIPDFMKSIFYRLMATSQGMAAKLAEEHLSGNRLKIAMQFLETNSDSILGTLIEHMMNNFQLRIYKTKGETKFFLSDRPILIQKFEGTDYLLPISPNICIGTTDLQPLKGNKISVYSQIIYLPDDDVKNINKKIIKNANEMLIIQGNEDVEFVKEWLV
ncbi:MULTISPECIES: DUF4238 domain-containing protein [Bacillus cereus group]|uniref:DUF4238 domain-containing protein n=1 Tax=Bacillus cereus group TaxID=86661 RepID=UPI00124F6E29|nr:DUF4238 domain-containing protein [Bacillus cereus]KAB2425281.1 DUF4238 domain-containing protein [Bacillus cereus]